MKGKGYDDDKKRGKKGISEILVKGMGAFAMVTIIFSHPLNMSH